MAAGPFITYSALLNSLAVGSPTLIKLDDSTANRYRIILCTSSYTPRRAQHSTYADVSGQEVATAGNYTAGGVALANVGTNSVTFGSPLAADFMWDADDVSWASSTITAKYAVIVHDADANAALASTDRLICYCDLETGGGSVSTTNGTFAINFNASGIFRIRANIS